MRIIQELSVSEGLFLLAGIGMLVSLPALDSWGFSLWLAAKAMYAAGVVVYIAVLMRSRSRYADGD